MTHLFCYAECRYAECRYVECRYVECHYVECRYVECRYAECRGVRCTIAAGALVAELLGNFFEGWHEKKKMLPLNYKKMEILVFPNLIGCHYVIKSFFVLGLNINDAQISII